MGNVLERVPYRAEEDCRDRAVKGGDLVAVARVAESGDEDEVVDGLGCHWARDGLVAREMLTIQGSERGPGLMREHGKQEQQHREIREIDRQIDGG